MSFPKIKATDGKGAFGVVYRGELQHTAIAVKVLNPVSFIILCYSCIVLMLQIVVTDTTRSTFSAEIEALTRQLCVNSLRIPPITIYLQVQTPKCDKLDGLLQEETGTNLPFYARA